MLSSVLLWINKFRVQTVSSPLPAATQQLPLGFQTVLVFSVNVCSCLLNLYILFLRNVCYCRHALKLFNLQVENEVSEMTECHEYKNLFVYQCVCNCLSCRLMCMYHLERLTSHLQWNQPCSLLSTCLTLAKSLDFSL